MATLVVLEKVVVEVGMETAFVYFTTLPTCASCSSLISVSIFPFFNMLHLLARAVAAKLPCHPSGRGRRSNLGKRIIKRAKAMSVRGGDLWRDKAYERVSSMASLRVLEAS
jgi:hypothetical protein